MSKLRKIYMIVWKTPEGELLGYGMDGNSFSSEAGSLFWDDEDSFRMKPFHEYIDSIVDNLRFWNRRRGEGGEIYLVRINSPKSPIYVPWGVSMGNSQKTPKEAFKMSSIPWAFFKVKDK